MRNLKNDHKTTSRQEERGNNLGELYVWVLYLSIFCSNYIFQYYAKSNNYEDRVEERNAADSKWLSWCFLFESCFS
jgi:hypothetical protein